MGQMVPGAGAPPLKRIRTVVIKDRDISTFKNNGYYNATEGVKDIIARFETILDIEYHGSPGLGGLKKEHLDIDRFGDNTHFSPAKRRRISQYNTGKELGRGGLPGSPRSSRRRRLAGGAATPPRRPTVTTRSTRAGPGRGMEELGLMEGPPGPSNNGGASSSAWTRPPPGGPPPPPPQPVLRKFVDTGGEAWHSAPPTPSPPGCGQPRPRPHPSPPAPAGAPRKETPRQAAPGTILEICKLWERGPPEQGGMSSSSSTETKKKLEKLDEISEGKNRKEAGSKNKEESSKNIEKKEDEDLTGRKKKTKVSEYFNYMPNSSIAYLDGETVEENCALPGTARAARPTSSTSRGSSTTSSQSTAAQESLPPSETRSSSPNSMFTNGSTLCAQYRQRTADFSKREDDRVSRSTNVCGPITANRLANRENCGKTSGYQGTQQRMCITYPEEVVQHRHT